MVWNFPSLAPNFNFENNCVCLMVACRGVEFSIFGSFGSRKVSGVVAQAFNPSTS